MCPRTASSYHPDLYLVAVKSLGSKVGLQRLVTERS